MLPTLPRWYRWLTRIALVATSLAITATATAQPTGWVMLPIADEEDAANLAAELRPHLEGAGARIVDDEGASLAFEQDVSAPTQSLSQSDIDAWAERSRSALQALARADYDTAREELLEAQRVAQRAADELNREAERARQVLDTCLFMARTFLETGERSDALRQVRACRVLVPQVEPRRHRHTPEIHELLTRVDGESSGATLEVTSSPSGCMTRVNGIAQGETPFTMQNVARGEYRVQVECTAERGRLHRVRMEDGVTRVHVDSRFDTRVRSQPIVSADPGFTVENAASIAETMQRTIVAIMRDGDGYRLWRLEPAGPTTEVRTSTENLRAAAEAVFLENSVDLRAGSPRAIAESAMPMVDDEGAPIDEPAATPNRRESLPGWRLGAGLGALAAGGGVFALALVFHLDRVETGGFYQAFTDATDRGFIENQAVWLETSLTNTALSAFGGGALAAIGVGLLIPKYERVPWWAWALGGAGVVVAGSALIPVLTRPECVDISNPAGGLHSDCVERDLAASRATLIAAASLPLLTVPISALLQAGGVERAFVPSINARARGLTLGLSGRF